MGTGVAQWLCNYCHTEARSSIPSDYGVKTEVHVLRKEQQMGLPSLNDLAVDGTLNTTNKNEKTKNYYTCLRWVQIIREVQFSLRLNTRID